MDMEPPPGNGSTPETYHRGQKRREALAALVVGVALTYAVLRWKPFRLEVSGPSMAPTLLPGDWALAVRPGRLRAGDVVVVEHPSRPGLEMVKRIRAAPGEVAPDGRRLGADSWWVQGDAPDASTDSRTFGPVSSADVRGVVRLVYWPRARRSFLRAPLSGTRPRG
jgi:nickel-type superoxide dismutase maturation protease